MKSKCNKMIMLPLFLVSHSILLSVSDSSDELKNFTEHDTAEFKHNVKMKRNLTVKREATVGSLEVIQEALFNSEAEFLSDVVIAGDVIVEGDIVGNISFVDLLISGNLDLPQSTDAEHGNIVVEGERFLSTFGENDIFIGTNSGNFTTTGAGNIAVGTNGLASVSTGFFDIAIGSNALFVNTTGERDIAIGHEALTDNVSGNDNIAIGVSSLRNNVSSNGNVAIGNFALLGNTSGSLNLAIGNAALQGNATGSNNIAVGPSAGILLNGDNNIAIGNPGVIADEDTIRIGTPGAQTRAFIAGIRGATTGLANALPVVIDSEGQLGTVSSSIRFKKNVKTLKGLSSVLMKLRPVIFNYIADQQELPQFGFIAEEVANIYPDLVEYDEKGQPYTVKYHMLYALLVCEIQNNHDAIEEHDAILDELQSQIVELIARVAALESMSNF